MAADSPLEQLKYQTLVFKVPIHCQGCKKLVHKVLRSIDGVYKTTIDSDLHKVTVTGNVKPDTLIKKLLKTGKHAELWPEPQPNNNNNNNNANKKKKKNAAAQPKDPSDKTPPATEDDTSTGEANTPKTPKPNDSPASTPENSTAGSSSGGKKSKENKESNGEVVAEVKKEARARAPAPAPVINMARPQGYNFAMYPLPTPPAYMMSYSTAHPSYGAAGYFPVQQSNYVYSTEPYMGSYYVPPAAPVDDGAEDGGDICGIM